MVYGSDFHHGIPMTRFKLCLTVWLPASFVSFGSHTVKFLFTWDEQPSVPVVGAIQVRISAETVQSYLVAEDAADPLGEHTKCSRRICQRLKLCNASSRKPPNYVWSMSAATAWCPWQGSTPGRSWSFSEASQESERCAVRPCWRRLARGRQELLTPHRSLCFPAPKCENDREFFTFSFCLVCLPLLVLWCSPLSPLTPRSWKKNTKKERTVLEATHLD